MTQQQPPKQVLGPQPNIKALAHRPAIAVQEAAHLQNIPATDQGNAILAAIQEMEARLSARIDRIEYR